MEKTKQLGRAVLQQLVQRLMCLAMIIITPLPPLYNLEKWREAENWKRLNNKKDACSGKQILRHLYAWKASELAGKQWGEWVATSSTPMHIIWARYQIWRKKPAPPLKKITDCRGNYKKSD